MAWKSIKSYPLGNGYTLDCVTSQEGSITYYNIYVVLDTVPWREVVYRVEKILDAKEANNTFKSLREKYSRV